MHGRRRLSETESHRLLHPPITISVAFVHGMLSGVRAAGRPETTFLADAGIPDDILGEPVGRVTAEQYTALVRSLIRRLDDECLGLLSRPLRRGSFALVARSAIGAETLAVATRRVGRVFRILQDDLELDLLRDRSLAGVAMRFSDPSVVRPPFLHESLARVFWRLLAWLVGGNLPPTRFDFAFATPTYASSYRKIFPASLRFAQPRTAFWFDAARLADPVVRNEASLRAFIADSPANVLRPSRAGEYTGRLRNYLQRTKPAWPGLSEAAEALSMSSSALQRHLATEGTSFQTLKDELRRDIAILRLSTSEISVASLAGELGFADSAAFQRAFKTWAGTAPGAYRRGR